MWQFMGSPIAGRGTEKEGGFDARESLTALPSWKARFQSLSPRTACVVVCQVSAGRG